MEKPDELRIYLPLSFSRQLLWTHFPLFHMATKTVMESLSVALGWMGQLVKFTPQKHEDLSSVLGTLYKMWRGWWTPAVPVLGDRIKRHVGFAGQTDRLVYLVRNPICHLRNDTWGWLLSFICAYTHIHATLHRYLYTRTHVHTKTIK